MSLICVHVLLVTVLCLMSQVMNVYDVCAGLGNMESRVLLFLGVFPCFSTVIIACYEWLSGWMCVPQNKASV